MTKRNKPTRTVRILTDRELATTTGGYVNGGVEDVDSWNPQAILKRIGGSGLVIPGLT